MSNARGVPNTPYGGASIYRESPSRHQPPLATPLSSNNSFSYVPPFPGDDSSPHQNVNRLESTANNLQPRSPPPPPSRGTSRGKHTNSTEDTDRDGQTQKKKKRRVALSCAECAKRKQRCNRETPCQHCVARRVPELCVPYTRPSSPPEKKGSGNKKDFTKVKTENEATAEKPRPSMLPTISVRVARLEAIVNAVVNRIPEVGGTKALKDWRINHAPATSPPPFGADDDDDEESVRPQTSGDRELDRPGSTSSTRSRRDDNSAEWGAEGEGEGDDGGVDGLDRATSGRNPLPQSMMHPSQPVSRGLDYHGTPAESLQRLFEDSGLNPHKVSELLKDLPERSLADKLVDWFFEKFNFVRYPIDDHAFKRAFETVYVDGNSPPAVLALPLVFIVLAISARIAPEAVIDTEERKRALSLRMYWSSKSAAIIASAVKAENIQLVETRICSGLYLVLMHERRLAEGWSEFRLALTIGQAIGLHRDGKTLGLDPYVTEYRRRLWSYLVHADATYSCLLGRPTSIDSACVDTLPPSNLNLVDLLENKLAKPRPITEPTFGTYLLLRRRLGDIVAKITHHFQRLTGQTQYRDVEALDAELKQFVADLPPTFTMLNHDKSYDSKLWYLPIHRYYIQTEILHFTIILHRPWLLRRLKSSRYNLSRIACFDAAITDYKIRQAFKIECPDFFETLLGSSFREFNAAMIAGISMIIDPRAAHSSDMRMIVQSFMEQHPHDPKADDFSQKEAAIIYTLHRRAQEMEERRTRRNAPRWSADNTSSQRPAPRSTGTRSAMHSPPHPAPESKDKQATSEPSRSVPLLPSPSGSVQAYFKGSYYGQNSGPTPPGLGTSPEEDHPQRLLDHWLMSNTSFGPGADSTMNQFNIGLYSMPVPTMVNDRGSDSASHGAGPHPSPHQYPPAGYQHGHPPQPIQVPEQMPWMDPSLIPVTPASALQAPAVISGMSGGVVGGDGNNTQYWNALIDGIVGGLPNYDPNFTTVG